jgi:hypothetical protein
MQTFKRICIEDRTFEDHDDPSKTITLQRGREYLTSAEKDGQVVVFTGYWFSAPIELFANAPKVKP